VPATAYLGIPAGAKLVKATHELFSELGSEGIATIAAVNGLAFGGGCELAMACDVRIAARSAMFGQAEIKLGIIPGFGGTQRLPRLVGVNKALEMNLIGDPILAEEAFEFGLVNRVVEDHELLDTALSWARRLAGQAPLAIERFTEEAERLLNVMERRLGEAAYLAGEDYSIADIAVYPWAIAATTYLAPALGEIVAQKPDFQRWLKRIGERPAVRRGMAIP